MTDLRAPLGPSRSPRGGGEWRQEEKEAIPAIDDAAIQELDAAIGFVEARR